MDGPRGQQWGYLIPSEGIPISLENAQTNYSDEDATIDFELSSGGVLTLVFPPGGGVRLFAAERQGDSWIAPRSASEFRRKFPVRVGAVPVLGPLEHEEDLLDQTTVARNLSTHRASRNFRNFWYHMDSADSFRDFHELLAETWPGMDMQRPEIVSRPNGKPWIAMMVNEQRTPRELYWAGFGFQIWCQLLSHMLRERDATIIVMDEPETYLHADLQRRIVSTIRSFQAQTLVATHSTEIIGESSADDILLIEEGKKSARRLRKNTAGSEAFALLGSVHNVTLTAIARAGKVLLVEGNDAEYLRPLGSRLGLESVSMSGELPVLPLGGHRVADAVAMANGIAEATDRDVKFAIVLDRDYRSTDECEAIRKQLQGTFSIAHIHVRKEIENYLIDTKSIEDALIAKKFQDIADIGNLLQEIFESLRLKSLALRVEAALDYSRRVGSPESRTSIIERATSEFESEWNTDPAKVVSGKQVIRLLNTRLTESAGTSLSPSELVAVVEKSTVDRDLFRFLSQVNRDDW